MSHKTKVLVNFIQDRSGSMTPVWEETLNGFKCFLNDLREKGAADGIDYLFSLTTFDALIDTIHDYWGQQIHAGATTFWEMFHPGEARLTRSHCHGWSAAAARVFGFAPPYRLSRQPSIGGSCPGFIADDLLRRPRRFSVTGRTRDGE